MAFWAFAGDKANEVLSLINTSSLTEEQAQMAVLNFSLQELSQGLSRSWSLGELLEQTLAEESSDDLTVSIIQLSHQLAEQCSQGWQSDDVSEVVDKMVAKLALPEEELRTGLYGNAKLARDMTQLYGVSEASKVIPQLEPDDEAEVDIPEQPVENNQTETAFSPYPEPNAELQLTIMQDMAAAFEERPNINIILEMVLEGLHRGIGMDRALFAILSKDHKQLLCKYALGENNETLSQQFHIDISLQNEAFKKVIDSKKACHLTVEAFQQIGGLATKTLELLGEPPYLIMPTIVRSKVIGLFIADLNASQREITDTDYIAFQQFCQQANMGLTFLTMQG